MTSENDYSPLPIEQEREAEGPPAKTVSREGVLCKKPKSARRQRLELRRLRSDTGGGDLVNRNRNTDGNADSTSSSSSSPTYSKSRSSPSDSDGDGAAAVGIYGGGEAFGLPCVSHGSVSLIGQRREMEDAVAVAPAFMATGRGGPAYDFFGVYDGHGGSRVALECRERMHVVLAEEMAARRSDGDDDGEIGWWREVMTACFTKMDGEMAEEAVAAMDMTEGSTAVVALVGPRRIVVANCGDSRAVLSRGGVAVPLSSDHKPERADELERVEAAGGRVIDWNGYRVFGVLATSRSIGDHYLRPYIISEPEVTVTDRTHKDEFLILATDGLWDVISNEVACRVARQCLRGRAARRLPELANRRTAAETAALLAELAISRGSRDNISIVVVELKRKRRS